MNLTKNMNRRLLIATIITSMMLVVVPGAYAYPITVGGVTYTGPFPPSCTGSTSIGVGIIAPLSARVGDTISYKVNLTRPNSNCGYVGVSAIFTFPNGTTKLFDGNIDIGANSTDPDFEVLDAGTYTVQPADVKNGFVESSTSATGTQLNPVVQANATGSAINNIAIANIALEKNASAPKVENGTNVTYTYMVTNTGSEDLNNVTVSDNTITIPGGNIGTLIVGQSVTLTANATLTTTNATITNIATVTGTDINGLNVTNTSQATVKVIHPNISLTKIASPTNGTAPLNVTYTYIVNNTGDTALSNVTITDNVFGAVGGPITLNPGASQIFTKNQTITKNTTNIATAMGTDQFGVNVTANATATVTIIPPSVGNQGCTPGFFKNNALKHGASQWPANFTPNETLAAAGFANATVVDLSNTTLLQALQFKGGPGLGGAEQILLRAAVSSLLNSASTGVKFPLTTSEVLSEVNAALATHNRDTILALASQLDQDNNLGCPLSQ